MHEVAEDKKIFTFKDCNQDFKAEGNLLNHMKICSEQQAVVSGKKNVKIEVKRYQQQISEDMLIHAVGRVQEEEELWQEYLN